MTSSNGNIFRVTGPLCGEFTGPGEFPTRRPVTQSFDVFFDLRLNKRLSKQSWGWWFETPSWSLWRQCNVVLWEIRYADESPTNIFTSINFSYFWRLIDSYSNHLAPNSKMIGSYWRWMMSCITTSLHGNIFLITGLCDGFTPQSAQLIFLTKGQRFGTLMLISILPYINRWTNIEFSVILHICAPWSHYNWRGSPSCRVHDAL